MVCKKTLDPVWNLHCEFIVESREERETRHDGGDEGECEKNN